MKGFYGVQMRMLSITRGIIWVPESLLTDHILLAFFFIFLYYIGFALAWGRSLALEFIYLPIIPNLLLFIHFLSILYPLPIFYYLFELVLASECFET